MDNRYLLAVLAVLLLPVGIEPAVQQAPSAQLFLNRFGFKGTASRE
jgi:hypothetical protein